MHACDVPLDHFGSNPQIATEIVKNSLGNYQFMPNEGNCWSALFLSCSNGISKYVKSDISRAEDWAEVIDLLTDKLMGTPLYPNARIHRLNAAVTIMHHHKADTSKKFRNPCWWIMDFENEYKDWFVELENYLVRNIFSARSDFCSDYLVEELSFLVTLNKYPMDEVCKNAIERWVNLWERRVP